jgi:ankyrin repeat protein
MKNSCLTPKGEGKILQNLVALSFLAMMGSSAQADNCNQFCTREFWENTSSVQIDAALNDIDPKARSDYAQTPLQYAASWGTLANVQKLLELGADVNARDTFGQSPIFSAASRGSTEVVKKLLEAGAIASFRKRDGESILHVAAERASFELVLLLVEAGADLEARTTGDFWDDATPLHYAARFGNPSGVLAMLTAGASGSVTDAEGLTPFDWAEKNEKLKGSAIYWRLNDARFE